MHRIQRNMTDKGEVAREFGPIDGLRVILSFWVVACHVCSLLLYFVYVGAPQQPDKLLSLSNSWWTFFSIGMGYQVDVFFMVSGFLTTWSLLTKKSHFSGNISRDIIVLLNRRLLRLWPAVLVLIVVTYFVGDLNSDNWPVLLSTLSFPINRNLPQAFGLNWSTRVDLQCTVILFAVFAALHKYNLINTYSAIGVSLLSFIPKLWRFFSARELVSYLSVRLSPNPSDILLPVYMTSERQNYYNDVLYPGQFEQAFVEDVGAYKLRIMKNEYLVYHQRITPFFIGFVLAVVMYSTRQQQAKAVGWMKKLFHMLCLLFSMLVVLQPLLLPLLTSQNGQPKFLQPGESPPIGLDLFISVLNRPIFAVGFAYLLYRCMLPRDHGLHARYLNSLLSHPILIYFAQYSYGIYTIHMKVMIEVMWRFFPPKTLIKMFGSENVFWQFLFCFVTTYVFTAVCAVAMHHVVEKPFAKYIAEPWMRVLEGRVLSKL
ncbi:hypothetical protein EON65_52780, partial [archaeon]